MTTHNPDLHSLATRFAQLPVTQRKVFLQKLDAAGIDFGMLPIPPRADRGTPVPASFAQTRVWLHARIMDEPAAYHITERLQLDGPLDANALRLSCDALIARHEALRTTFFESAEGVWQTVHSPLQCPWQITDLSGLPVQAREARAREVAQAAEMQPFDLSCAPLLRAHLIRLDADTHWLALTVHHIVTDGWSADVMLIELAAFYRAYTKNEAVSLAPLPIQYADYALWQRHWLDAGVRERQLAYWRARLAACQDVLMLPGAAPRPARRSAQGARHRIALDAPLAARVRTLASTHRATPFAVLTAALALLLARMSDERAIQIGMPSANRERAETSGLIGFFVNTLTLALQVRTTDTFASLLTETQRSLVDAQAHQDVPFEEVVDSLDIVRSASHHPIFQVMAAYRARRALPTSADVHVTELPSGAPFAKFDLTAAFEERDDGSIDADFVYAVDLFEADAVERFARRFIELVSHATNAPDTRMDELQWVPEVERRELVRWNDNAPAVVPAFEPVHERIAAFAREKPGARGVIDCERALTRGEVDGRATRLAECLVAAGVRAETRIGVALTRSVDLFVALIAALKSGGAFVPLDPAHPRARLAQVIDDARIDYVLTDRASLPALALTPAMHVWCVDDEVPQAARPAAPIALPVVAPQQAAYVIYTSGSTGKPKGVVVDHGSFARHCAAIAERYGTRETDVFLLFQSVNFDGAHEGWFSQYMSGAAVAVTADTLWPPVQTCRMMTREAVTMTYAPPGCATQLAEWALEHGAPPSLRSLTVGGEATSREAFALLRRAFPNARIVNGYGPTETVITPMLWMFNPDDPLKKLGECAYLPIGNLVGARTAHVLDARLAPLPVGVIGELYLGGEGVGVARGYLDRPALTAERFVPDPFGASGARLYRTGDLVRRRADGVFDFIGRVDHQVKLRGLRIELGEIEAQLAAHEDVREAVAVVRGTGAHAALVAYVELSEQARSRAAFAERAELADVAEFDAHLRRTLPDYMVPAHIVVLDALPRNANSKVDRAALPEPVRHQRVYQAPAAGLETALAKIWHEVLGVSPIGRSDHFFTLGGHSLAAVRVATRVAERLAHEVPVRALFEAPTLAQYAQRVTMSPRVQAASASSSISMPAPDAEEDGLLPPSAAQCALWFLWRAEPASAAYNIPVALRMCGPLDPNALRIAFARVAARHPALRSRLIERDGKLPRQRIDGAVPVALPVVDLSESDAASEATREARAVTLTDEDALTPFDLGHAAPLWRARLLRLAADDHVLSLVVHHIVSDGTSIELWLDQVRSAYIEQIEQIEHVRSDNDAPAIVEPNPTSLDAQHPAQLAFWRDTLDNLPDLILPAPASGRVTPPQWLAGRIAFEFDETLVRRAKAAAHAASATLPMLLHAALNVVLYRATGATDQPIGVLASTRESTNTAAREALGLFINAVVVRTRLTDGESPAAILSTVRDAALSAYAHADVPFADVVTAVRARRAAHGNPLFRVMFNYLRPTGAAEREWAGVSIEAFNDVRHRVVFELELDIVEHADGRVSGAFSYACELVDGSFVEALTDGYLRAVREFVNEPHRAIGTVHAAFERARYTSERSVRQRVPHGPAVEIAAALSRIWAETFERPAPARHVDLFDAGATSCDVVRFVDALRAAGYALTIADIFAVPHFTGLGGLLAVRTVATGSQASTTDPLAQHLSSADISAMSAYTEKG
ncbi:amino acid adenylation domain-containing protein [Trinickia sp. LjRoot230]|uniref:amino acid adenylation domain-containing protein n=1 Tax=Trinickia sp. LjRoot230 TaxID=3342288 RepID=UPI003ECCDC47